MKLSSNKSQNERTWNNEKKFYKKYGLSFTNNECQVIQQFFDEITKQISYLYSFTVPLLKVTYKINFFKRKPVLTEPPKESTSQIRGY